MSTTTGFMLRVAPDFVPPEYAQNVRYSRFGLCMLEVGRELLP
jgi:hypothetical protein